MEKIFRGLRFFYALIPRDARAALGALAFSCAIMSVSIFSVGYLLPAEKTEDAPPAVFSECGLEPYALISDSVLASADAEACSVSEDLGAELLSRAIDSTVPYEEYAVRVAFGAVLLNRVKSSDFPSTLSGVIMSSGIKISSFEGDIPERTLHAARDALLGVDPTLGALYVMDLSDARLPEFEERVTAVYGNYAFMK